MIGRLKTAAEIAADEQQQRPGLLRPMLAGAAGLGVGTGAGYAAMRGIDALSRRSGGAGIPHNTLFHTIAPLATGGLGMALASWQAHQQEMMKRDRQGR